MARWKFVHSFDEIAIQVEADTWKEALAKIGQGKALHSTIKGAPLPPGLWEVSEEPEKVSTPWWKFVYRHNEMSAVVEADNLVEAAAKLLAWDTVDFEINVLGLDPKHWQLAEGPTDHD